MAKQMKKRFEGDKSENQAMRLGYPRREKRGCPTRGQEIADGLVGMCEDHEVSEGDRPDWRFERAEDGHLVAFIGDLRLGAGGLLVDFGSTLEATESRTTLFRNYIAYVIDQEVERAERRVRRQLASSR